MPTEKDIARAYPDYYTRVEEPVGGDTLVHRVDHRVRKAYVSQKYGYGQESLSTWDCALGLLGYLYPGRRIDYDSDVMYLPARPQGKLLDVGCGSGRFVEVMQQLGWDAHGIDIDASAIETAKGQGLQVKSGELEQQGYLDDEFDAITISHVIEHVADPIRLMRECRRILTPEGCLVAATPNIAGWGHQLFRANWFALDPPRHLYLFTRKTLRQVAERAGFLSVDCLTNIHLTHRIFMASVFIARSGHALHHPSKKLTLLARAMQMVEWALLQVRPDWGTEIVLKARKA